MRWRSGAEARGGGGGGVAVAVAVSGGQRKQEASGQGGGCGGRLVWTCTPGDGGGAVYTGEAQRLFVQLPAPAAVGLVVRLAATGRATRCRVAWRASPGGVRAEAGEAGSLRLPGRRWGGTDFACGRGRGLGVGATTAAAAVTGRQAGSRDASS